jgi:DNA-binding response OmpR family regulator
MKKVLVVDDDPDISEAIMLMLTDDGYDAEMTTKGNETNRIVKKYKPDLIILDLLLSGNDGQHICKTLKHTDETKHIPIIMISAHPSAKAAAEECGAESFVAKPFSLDELLGEIEKLIGTPKVENT